jgi:hypothetical protein
MEGPSVNGKVTIWSLDLCHATFNVRVIFRKGEVKHGSPRLEFASPKQKRAGVP